MYKKLLTILIVFAFLVTSLGVISAADDSNDISVKVVWNGDSTDDVTVNLLKDGQIVDTVKLNEKNSWKTIFKVEDDGNYEVKEVISDDYSTKITGNPKAGFVITNTLVKEDVLGAGGDNPADDVSDDKLADGEGSNPSDGGGSNPSDGGSNPIISDQPADQQSNGTGNSTNNETSDDNSTDETTGDESTDDDSTDDDSGDDDATTTKTTTTKTTTTKVVKKDDKKPENTTKTKKNNTGFPIIVLVIAVFVAAFIPFSRKK